MGVRKVGAKPEILPDPGSPEEKWIILICTVEGASAEAHPVKAGDVIEHQCPKGALKLQIGDDFLPQKTVEDHYCYLFEELAGGYIDLSQKPPRAVTIRR